MKCDRLFNEALNAHIDPESRTISNWTTDNPTGIKKVFHFTSENKEDFLSSILNDSGKDIGVLGPKGLYVDITGNTWGKDTKDWLGEGLEKVELIVDIKKPLIITKDNWQRYRKLFEDMNNVDYSTYAKGRAQLAKLYENLKGFDAIIIPENSGIPDEYLSVPQMVLLNPEKQVQL